MAQVQLGVVVQPATVKPFVAICNRPSNHVSNRVVIEVQLQRDGIVETNVFGVYGVALGHAKGERNNSGVLPPNEEIDFIRHEAAQLREVAFGKFLEV